MGQFEGRYAIGNTGSRLVRHVLEATNDTAKPVGGEFRKRLQDIAFDVIAKGGLRGDISKAWTEDIGKDNLKEFIKFKYLYY